MAVVDVTSGGPESEPLYENHRKIYPKYIKGKFRTIKTWTDIVLLAIYFIGPWLRWHREGGLPDQMILLDMTNRRGYVLGIEIWPQQVYYLAGLLIFGAIGLFFVTSLFGRVWCGFTCIQTVFTDVFVAVERLFEGDRNQRIRLDRGGWTGNKIWRKTATYTVWVLISLAVGWTWVIYYNEAFSSTNAILHGNITGPGGAGWGMTGFALMVAALTFLLAGFAREQVCIYMCPWPRFQAAMFDEDSLVVTYEEWRGEKRGPARKGDDFSDRGHCIDCKQCVQVCPTGIDIRDGSQLACIGCALCVDACDSIMTMMNLPTGLITYDSYSRQAARTKGEVAKYRFLRPRTYIYAAILVAIVGGMGYSLLSRTSTGIDVLHERSPLWVALAGNNIRNGYDFKILRQEASPATYTLTLKGLPGGSMRAVYYDEDKDLTSIDLPVKPDTVGTFRIYVTVPASQLKSKAINFDFVLTDRTTGVTTEHDALFAGPDQGN